MNENKPFMTDEAKQGVASMDAWFNNLSTKMFTVVIGCYNQVHILDKVMKGWMDQDYGEGYEVFLCDDCSTDGTKEWAEKYAEENNKKEHPKFKFTYCRLKERIEPGSLGMNLNQALPLSEGQYTFFCMGDTIPEPDTLKNLARHVGSGRVLCGVRKNIDENGAFIDWDWRMVEPEEFMDHDLIPINDDCPWAAITGNGLCVPTWALKEIGGWNEEYHGWESDDYDLALRLYEHNLEFFHTPKVVIQHINHPHQPRAMKNVELFKKAVLNYKNQVRDKIISISLDFDDYSPSYNGLFYLDQIHEHYPDCKISLFTIPLKTLGEGQVDSWENAMDLVEETNKRPWLEILPHGYFHSQHEVENWTYDQTNLAIKAWETLFTKLGMNWKKVMKAPHWQYGYEALRALRDNGYTVAVDPSALSKMKIPDGLKIYTHNWGVQFPFANKTEIKGHGHITQYADTCIADNLGNIYELPTDKPWKFVSEFEHEIIHSENDQLN